jgi:hypothetical protein
MILLLVLGFASRLIFAAGNYKNFTVSVYTRAYEVREMKDLKKLDSIWTIISSQLKVDKIYLETHRDNVIVDDATIEAAKKYFLGKGLKVAGGITFTKNEANRFQTFCYSNPEQRKEAKKIAELTARHFDEIILDDFFFTSCKCDYCIKAKGNLSWTEYRLKLMTEAARNLIINPAKAINPKVKVIIKYPNWYEHFQGLGFNLKTEPELFDGIYTGTETRDPVISQQHLQQYESYLIWRYFDNIKPGGNGGGWVDPFGSFYLDRYDEQLWLTLFSKAPEITLFDFRSIQKAFTNDSRAPWQNGKTSFNYDEMIDGWNQSKVHISAPTYSLAAGYAFNKVDRFLDKLGKPVGIKSYKPYQSKGEDFLQNYFGMIGLPMDIVPEFPTDSKLVILTESAGYDPSIIDKIKKQLVAGKNVAITSGLLRVLQGKGIEDIVELKYTDRKVRSDNFAVGWNRQCKSKDKILLPQIEYLTNDSWEDISCIAAGNGFPVLHMANYGNGTLYVLTIPDNYADLYNYPKEVLDRIRQVMTRDLDVRIEGNSQISLFAYDNNTIIVESFLPEETSIDIVTGTDIKSIKNILTTEELTGKKESAPPIWRRDNQDVVKYPVKIQPHSFLVFQILK